MHPDAPATAAVRAVLPSLIRTAAGTRRADGAVAVTRREKPDVFLYGPYWRLRQGRYRLDFACTVTQPLDAQAVFLGVEVLVQNRTFLAVRDYCASELPDGRGSILFEVPSALASDAGADALFEFRFLNFATADFAVTSVSLAPTDAEPGPSPLRWRLASRLPPSGLKRLAGWFGGSVSRGPRPPLKLPAGTYRLWIGASLPAAAKKGAIVATVRVGRDVRASRRFAPAELRAGRQAVTFDVPERLAFDHGADDALSVVLRNAPGLTPTLHEVDVERLTQEEGVGADVPTPGIVGRSGVRVVIVGNCQAEVLAQGFRSMLGSRRLQVRYHFVHLQANLHDSARRDLLDCDLLFVEDISDFAAYPLGSAIPDRLAVLRFPMLRLSTPWPFDTHNGLRDSLAERREAMDPMFPNLDSVLARLRRDIPDREARFAAYAALEIEGIVDIRRLAGLEKRRLLEMDRKHGCDLGARILEGYCRRPMFHSIGHPGGKLLVALLRHMCRLADLRPGWVRPGPMDLLRNTQIPVHPLVAERLGIGWATRDTRYDFRGERLTWEQYTRRYIDHFG